MNQKSFISVGEVCRRTSLSRTSINNHRRQGLFPEPVKLGEKRIAFIAAEIDEWMAIRIAERDGRAQR